MRFKIFTYLIALLVAVGCDMNNDGGAVLPSGEYGTLQFGDEQMPIHTVKVSDSEDWLLVVLSPMEEDKKLTTNAIIGLKKELLGATVDVVHKYPNSDYIVVYEDPQCYYAPYRSLQSGTIYMQQKGDYISVAVDVVLNDGTPLRYSYDKLPK